MRINPRVWLAVFGGVLASSSACSDEGSFVSTVPTVDVGEHEGQGMAPSGQLRTVSSLRAKVTDNLMVRLEYFEVDCVSGARLPAGILASAVVKTAPQHMTPGIPGLEDLPLDHGSKHIFSDHMQTLRPGCYDVIATPVDASGALDSRCKPAQRSKVQVQAGKTGEIVLMNQCEGTGTGGLDSIVVRNHPPELVDISFENSKFGLCAQDIVVCATAMDPDGDPIRFEWEQLPTSAPALDPGTVIVQSVLDTPGMRRECIRYRPEALGRFDIKIRAFDLARVKGELLKFEEITEEGHVSKDELDFFFYSLPDAGSGGSGGSNPRPESGRKSGILILASSVVDGVDSEEAIAARAVLEKIRLATPKDAEGNAAPVEAVELVTDEQWSLKSLREFSGYRAIILGDPDCGDTPPEIPTLWASAVNGNVLIYGSNPSRHEGKLPVIEQAIAFASKDETRTGAYISTSCYYHSAPSRTRMGWLAPFGEKGAKKPEERQFEVVHADLCPNKADVVASFELDLQGNGVGYENAALSEWGCSAHNYFQSWPANFEPMALITDNGTSSRYTDFPGEPYILARGAYVSSCGNGVIDVGEDCDDSNKIDGDGCDRSCHDEVCGDGLLQGLETCDDGNEIDGDGCSGICAVELDPCER